MANDEQKDLSLETNVDKGSDLDLAAVKPDNPSEEKPKPQESEASPENGANDSNNSPEDVPKPKDTNDGEQNPPQPSQGEAGQSTESDMDKFKVLVDEGVQQILSAFKGLQDSFDAKLRYDEKKDSIIDRQHSELEQFKKGLIDKITMQVVNDLISEADSYKKLITYYENIEYSEDNFKKLKKILFGLPESICDILERLGVTSYSSEVGLPFDPNRQRVLMTTETGDKAKDKTVRALMRFGFEKELEDFNDHTFHKKVIRPELVDVFVYKPELDVPQPSAETNQQEAEQKE